MGWTLLRSLHNKLLCFRESQLNICESCENQKRESRRGSPHKDLHLQSEKPIRGSMFGGWEEFTYYCKVCGATVHHTNDKNEIPPFWTVFTKEE